MCAGVRAWQGDVHQRMAAQQLGQANDVQRVEIKALQRCIRLGGVLGKVV